MIYHYEPFRQPIQETIKKMHLRILNEGDQIRYFLDDSQEEFFDGHIKLLSPDKVLMKVYGTGDIKSLPCKIVKDDVEVYGTMKTTFDLSKLRS